MAVRCYYYEPEPPFPAYMPEYAPAFVLDAEWEYHPDYVPPFVPEYVSQTWQESEYSTECYTPFSVVIASLDTLRTVKTIAKLPENMLEFSTPEMRTFGDGENPRRDGRLALNYGLKCLDIAFRDLSMQRDRPCIEWQLRKLHLTNQKFQKL